MSEAKDFKDAQTLRPVSEWSEEDGDVIWWTLPIDEPPHIGSPLDSYWPDYFTHWTPIVIPKVVH